ncbi:hypothetical protein [Fulvivirga ligni]|uniref:hypothetical protein n=1 Tax=Fulvivirga ligni TaxID=2904246 RepID=UPI001F3C723F|nr:hypothetical protein [Fulvivirga ligni]UII23917.1 hypothetical protein LVD16_11880 [Fulvivirga ligni]
MEGRIRVYLNYAVLSFLPILIFRGEIRELQLIFTLIFNLFVYKKIQGTSERRLMILVPAISVSVFLFILQSQYFHYIDGGCIKWVSDWSAMNSYVSMMVISSVVIWELGLKMERCF